MGKLNSNFSTYLVKQIIEKDGQPNLLGICLARNGGSYLNSVTQKPLMKPEHLQLARVKCCTVDVIQPWFTTFQMFLLLNNLKDKANRT